GELADRALIDVCEALAPGFVQRCLTCLLEELADHARDPQELRGLGDGFFLITLALRRHRERLHDVGRSGLVLRVAHSVQPSSALGYRPASFTRNAASACAIRTTSPRSTLSSREW